MAVCKPIYDAPRDGTRILAWFPDSEMWIPIKFAEEFLSEVDVWLDDYHENVELSDGSPTHWIEFPRKPTN